MLFEVVVVRFFAWQEASGASASPAHHGSLRSNVASQQTVEDLLDFFMKPLSWLATLDRSEPWWAGEAEVALASCQDPNHRTTTHFEQQQQLSHHAVCAHVRVQPLRRLLDRRTDFILLSYFSSHANQLLRTYHHKKGWEEVCNVILTGSNTSLCLDVIKCRADVDEATYGGRDRVLLEPAPTSGDRRGLKREYPTVCHWPSRITHSHHLYRCPPPPIPPLLDGCRFRGLPQLQAARGDRPYVSSHFS